MCFRWWPNALDSFLWKWMWWPVQGLDWGRADVWEAPQGSIDPVRLVVTSASSELGLLSLLSSQVTVTFLLSVISTPRGAWLPDPVEKRLWLFLLWPPNCHTPNMADSFDRIEQASICTRRSTSSFQCLLLMPEYLLWYLLVFHWLCLLFGTMSA